MSACLTANSEEQFQGLFFNLTSKLKETPVKTSWNKSYLLDGIHPERNGDY
jgi:hypothetical protein